MRGDRGGTEAVSSVVGTVLMLAITMVTFAAFGVVAVSYFNDGGAQAVQAELAVTDRAGAYLLTHAGGDPVPVEGTRIVVNVGGTSQEVPLADFAAHGLEPGATQWRIGDVLCVSCYFGNASRIHGTVVVGPGQVLGEEGLREGCDDVDVPVATWTTQDPADVTGAATGAVTVTLVATDDCSIDASQPPHLWWSVLAAAGTPATDAGAMTQSLPGTWTATIPAQSWGSLTGDVLVYQARGLRDTAGNEVDSATVAETIDIVPVADPGQPFVDLDGDGLYTEGVDSPLDTTLVLDGSFDAGSGALTIPSSVGPIESDSISFTAGGPLVIATDLTATTGTIDLTGGDITIGEGTTVSAPEGMTLVPGDVFTGDGATFTSSGTIQIGSTSPGQLGTTVSLVGAVVDNRDGTDGITIAWSDGDLDATGASFLTNGAILVGGLTGGHSGLDIILDGATLDNTGGTSGITVQHIDGAIAATGASFRTRGAITMPADGAITLDGATLDTSGGSGAITVTAGGALSAQGAAILSGGAVSLAGAGADLDSACVSATGTLTVAAGTGALSATGPSAPTSCSGFASTGSQTWTGATIAMASATARATGASADITLTASSGGIDVAGADLRAVRNLAATVPNGSRVTVTGAVLDDQNDALNIPNPTASYVTGSAAAGYGVE